MEEDKPGVVVTFRLPEDMHKLLTERAKEMDLHKGQLVRKIIVQHFIRSEARRLRDIK